MKSHVIEAMREQGYVTPAEAAKAAGVSLATIYNWVASGKLGKPKRHGLRHMFVSTNVLRHVAGDSMSGGS